MRLNYWWFCVLTAMCSACKPTAGGREGGAQEVVSEAVAAASASIDQSTPDRAIRSYWKAMDGMRLARYRLSLLHRKERHAAAAPLRGLLSPAMEASDPDLRDSSPPDVYERDILEVEMQTGSRAVILVAIRNSTPLGDKEKVIGYDDRKRREVGDRYRYVLELDGAKWRVVELWELNSWGKDPWRKRRPWNYDDYIPTQTFDGC